MSKAVIQKMILGTAQFGLDYGIANRTGRILHDEARRILSYAFEQGVEIIDTAYQYGESEELLGQLLKEGQEEFRFISKLPSSPGKKIAKALELQDEKPEAEAHLKKFVRESFEHSFKRLGVNRLYGYLMHHFKDFGTTLWSVFEELKEEGKVEKIGLSLYEPWQLDALLERDVPFDLIQIPYSVFDQRFEEYFPLLKKRNVEICVRSVFLQGAAFLNPTELPTHLRKMQGTLKRLNEIAEQHVLSTNALCLNFALLNPFVDRVIIGVDNLEQFQKDIEETAMISKIPAMYDLFGQLEIKDESIVMPSRWQMNAKTGVIVQARMGSTRLPGKTLMKVLNKPILEYVIERIKQAKNIDEIIVATSNQEQDQPIVDLAKRLGVKVFRGSEGDVLDRYYQAAKEYGLTTIVRITADCPLIDPHVIDQAVRIFQETPVDYCSNTAERTFPDGEDVEVFSFAALEEAWCETPPLDREHVTRFMRQHPDRFKVTSFTYSEDFGKKRWTLDHAVDFQFIKMVIEGLYPSKPEFGMEDILEFLKRNPDVERINQN